MALTGLQINKLLPRTNCKECGSNTCLAFAMKLAAKKAELAECPYASDEAIQVLGAAAEPPIRGVALGPSQNRKFTLRLDPALDAALEQACAARGATRSALVVAALEAYLQDPPTQRSPETLRTQIRELLPMLAERYKVASLGIFGSYRRNEQTPGSDLDLLVEFHETPSLFTVLELRQLLSETLGLTVDLVMKDSLKKQLEQRILDEVELV